MPPGFGQTRRHRARGRAYPWTLPPSVLPVEDKGSTVMEVHRLDPQAASTLDTGAGAALAGLVGVIGDRAFGQRAIEQIDRLVPLNWWTVYRMSDATPPSLHAGGHLGAEDCVADSFGAYRGGLWRDDQVFALARERLRGGGAVMTHLHAREMRPRHRRRIYTRHKLAERLSLVQAEANAPALAVNLYRHVEVRPFSDTDRERLRDAAGLILACVSRHLAIRGAEGETPAAATTAPAADCLAALPRREREVCERLLRGWTHEGVGADLGLRTTTVKTYRDRAFERLGIHHRSELFALALRSTGAIA